MAFDQNSYQADYKRKNYDVVRALVPKGHGATLKTEANKRGISVSQLIVNALEDYCKLDLSKPNGE